MKTSLQILVTCILFAVVSFSCQAQFQEIPGTFHYTVDNPTNNTRRSMQDPKSCTIDTANYLIRQPRTRGLTSLSVKAGNSLGQYFPVPKTGITIHGFTFYSWHIDSMNRKMKLACKLYKAGLDSLPSGTALRSDTISVDTVFNNGQIAGFIQTVKFKDSIYVDFPYILSVEAGEVDKTAGVILNNFRNREGQGDNLLSGSISGTWYNARNLNVGGTRLDGDMIYFPHISYKFGAGFTTKDTCFNYKDTVRFANHTSDSTVSSNKFYNFYAYYAEANNNQFYRDYPYRWNFGDNNGTYYMQKSKWKYNTPGNYTVTLIATSSRFSGGFCIDTSSMNIRFMPEVPGIKGTSSICEGDSSDLLAYSLNVKDYEWFHGVFDSVPFSKSNILNTGSIAIKDTVYVRALNGTCVSGKQQKTYVVNENPKDPTVTHDSICTKSSANLTAKADVGIINWYADSTSNTIIHTGEVYQTGILSSNFTYYVEALNNGCVSPHRVPVTAYVSSSFAPVSPVLTQDTTLCLRSTKSINLTASVSSSDTIRWYDVPSAGAPIHIGTNYTYNTTKVGVKSFYVESWNGTCASSREAIKIETKDFPDFFKTESATICKGQDAILKAVTFTGEVNWFKSKTGGSSFHNGLTYSLTAPGSSDTFYAESSEGVCVNPVREKIALTVNVAPAFTEINSDQICAKSSATLSVKTNEGTIKWYDKETGGNLLTSGNSYKTPVLLYSQDYYVESSSNGCTSARKKVSAVVLARPVAGFQYSLVWPGTITLTPIAGSGVNYLWDFGDGNTSTQGTPKHTYAQYGKYPVTLVVTSKTTGCKDTVTIQMDADFTGINDIDELKSSLFPNPSKGDFIVSSTLFKADEWNFVILDVTGKKIQEHTVVPNKEQVNLFIGTPGLYFIRATNKDKALNFKALIN